MEDSSSAPAQQSGNGIISDCIEAVVHGDNGEYGDQCMQAAVGDEYKQNIPISLSLVPQKRPIDSEGDFQKNSRRKESTSDFSPPQALTSWMITKENPRVRLRQAILAAGKPISLKNAEADDLNRVARAFGLHDCRGPDDTWSIDGLLRPLYPHQLLAVFFMLKRELALHAPFCGLNADGMGLGKTVEALATVVINRPDEHDLREGRKVTLWVAPKSSHSQVREAARGFCCESRLPNVLIYDRAALTKTHGDDLEDYLQEQDIIIVGYESLIRDFPAGLTFKYDPMKPDTPEHLRKCNIDNFGPLMKMKYYRVILDEAHRIKNEESRKIYAYLMFLQVPEVKDECLTFRKLCEEFEDKTMLDHVIKDIMIRRKYSDTILGRQLIELPIAHREVIVVPQTKEERVIYKWFAKRTRENFNKQLAGKILNRKRINWKRQYERKYTRKGRIGREDKKKPFCIVDILRLRQMACDLSLIEHMLRGKGRELESIDNMLSELVDQRGANHLYDMISQWRQDQIDKRDVTNNPTPRQGGPEYLRKPKLSFKSQYLANIDMNPDQRVIWGSKMEAVKESIQKHLADGPNDKLLIFNEFLYCANLVGYILDQLKIKHIYYFGNGSSDSRDKAIAAFENDPELRVMLLSMKCGGLALNLAVANRVITVEPWWNKGIEEQALARVHRLGQAKEVYHTRIIAKRTIETNMVALQDAKELAISQALEGKFSGDISSLEQTARLMGRVVYDANGNIVAVNDDEDSDAERDLDDEDLTAKSEGQGA
ncbi:P-loop containing nucleoside triphosphate hydrolase protein [Xylaria arbuscula]|nr:P-loop containing nucleoside triphosphate hydrolase protein [Xylaria arbuscula]